MTFTFYNDIGKFKLFGSGTDGFRVCAVSGLEPVELSRSVQTYIGEDGCVENSSQYVQRIITISGDLKTDENSKNEIRNAMRVLSRKCTLLIEDMRMARCIEVNAATFTLGKKHSKYQTFVIQATCDYPHFSDRMASDGVLFKREELLSSTSILPTVLSRRISSCTINNMGDLKIYPVITIIKTDNVVRESEILIENKTTGKKVLINKSMANGEKIVIDIKNRKITSNIDGNILGTLDIYCSLSEFMCELGENEISATVGGEQAGLQILISFYNEYLEAI